MNSENIILDKEQIENLFQFTKDHYVEYYDLQTELVDHLANDIEAILKENPNLNFEDARTKAFKKFGVFGFGDVVSQRERAMSKRYYKYFLEELKQWFTLPKLIITLALFAVFYMMFYLAHSFYITYLFYAVLVVWSFYKMFHLNRNVKKRTKISDKKWLLEDIIFKQAGGVGIVIISQSASLFNHSENISETKYLIAIMAVLFTFLFLLNYISLELLPNKAEAMLKEIYPEYGLEVL